MSSPRLLALGDAAWTVEFGDAIDPQLHARALGYAQRVEEARAAGVLPGALECLPTFRSVTLYFDPMASEAEQLGRQLMALAQDVTPLRSSGRRLLVPILFGGDAGPDLDTVAKAADLASEEVVARMTSSVLTVYLLGFMPGFPYLGGLPPELAQPRLASPRLRVPPRSLAITGSLCGLYPFASPGGWLLIGRTPVPLFDPLARSPTLFEPGDEVMWRAIDAAEFARIERAAEGWSACLLEQEAPWPR